MNTQALDNKIELIQWLSSIEDTIIIDKLISSGKKKLLIGGMIFQSKRKSLLKRGFKMQITEI